MYGLIEVDSSLHLWRQVLARLTFKQEGHGLDARLNSSQQSFRLSCTHVCAMDATDAALSTHALQLILNGAVAQTHLTSVSHVAAATTNALNWGMVHFGAQKIDH